MLTKYPLHSDEQDRTKGSTLCEKEKPGVIRINNLTRAEHLSGRCICLSVRTITRDLVVV